MARDEVHVERTYDRETVCGLSIGTEKITLTADEAIEVAMTLVELALHHCSLELLWKFNNLVRLRNEIVSTIRGHGL